MTEDNGGPEYRASGDASILCVDDEPNVLSALKRTLTSFGYRVRTAEGGQEGLNLLQSEAAEIVISDMRMPGMDGVSFLEYVSVRWPDSTRILLTGYASLDATVDAINRGRVFSYISKPWDDEDLQVTIKQALYHHEVIAENRRLANRVREQQREIEHLRRLSPEILEVERDPQGAISLDEDDSGESEDR